MAFIALLVSSSVCIYIALACVRVSVKESVLFSYLWLQPFIYVSLGLPYCLYDTRQFSARSIEITRVTPEYLFVFYT